MYGQRESIATNWLYDKRMKALTIDIVCLVVTIVLWRLENRGNIYSEENNVTRLYGYDMKLFLIGKVSEY